VYADRTLKGNLRNTGLRGSGIQKIAFQSAIGVHIPVGFH